MLFLSSYLYSHLFISAPREASLFFSLYFFLYALFPTPPVPYFLVACSIN